MGAGWKLRGARVVGKHRRVGYGRAGWTRWFYRIALPSRDETRRRSVGVRGVGVRGAVGVAVGLALDRFGVGLAARRPQRLRRGICSRFFPAYFCLATGRFRCVFPVDFGWVRPYGVAARPNQSAQWRALVVVVVPYVSVTRWEV